MTHPSILAAASLMLATGIIGSAAGPQAQAKAVKVPEQVLAKNVGDLTPEEEQQFSDAAEATLERVCIACHPFENIIKTRRTVREWSDQVSTMSQRGAPGTEPDFALVKKSLTRYYGIVRFNTASVE